MIIGLKGIVHSFFDESVGIDVKGVVYEVFMAPMQIADLGAIGTQVELHTYLRLSNDVLAIYGFAEAEQLRMFHKLISVNSVGPRNAQAILSHLSISQVAEAVLTENTVMLTGVPGVGARTASRIVLELKDKIDVPILGIDELSSINLDEDIITALTVLGYSRNEITAVLASVEFTENELELEDRIKIVLSRMG